MDNSKKKKTQKRKIQNMQNAKHNSARSKCKYPFEHIYYTREDAEAAVRLADNDVQAVGGLHSEEVIVECGSHYHVVWLSGTDIIHKGRSKSVHSRILFDTSDYADHHWEKMAVQKHKRNLRRYQYHARKRARLSNTLSRSGKRLNRLRR